MLRQVFITKNGEIIFRRDFGKALDLEGFNQAYKQIIKEASKIGADKTKYHDYFQYRIGYLTEPEKNIIFFFVSDLSDKFANIQKELERCRKEFLDMFGPILDDQIDEDTFEIFDPTIELIHKNLRPKISLVGFSGVGKTTITRLITAQDIPMEHVPTITGDIGTIKIGKLHFHLWDFAGQEQFSFLWNNFIKGSDAVLLITDSTLENCEKSRYFTELIKKEAPYAHTACIGNKQDLPEAMPIADIERILGMKAYSMIAVDPDNRDKMITIIADVLEMSGEVSPLLKPLIQRDKIMKQAEEALEEGNFQQALHLFEELADLSLELGDDRVSQDFHEKAMKIKAILQQFEPKSDKKESLEVKSVTSQKQKEEKTIPKESVTPPPAPKTSVTPPPAPKTLVTPPPAPKTSVTPPPAPKTSVTPPPKPKAIPVDQTDLQISKGVNIPKSKSTSTNKEDKLEQLLEQAKAKKLKKQVAQNHIQEIQKEALDQSIKSPIPPLSAPNSTSRSSNLSVPSPKIVSQPPPSNDQSSTKSDMRALITDLKIKVANVNKTLLDMEMQNITGELSDDEFANKSKRLESVKARLEKQIQELEEI
ncbi:ADP-ribosylation factor-like protein [Candidatus Harpocratesius sp.]